MHGSPRFLGNGRNPSLTPRQLTSTLTGLGFQSALLQQQGIDDARAGKPRRYRTRFVAYERGYQEGEQARTQQAPGPRATIQGPTAPNARQRRSEYITAGTYWEDALLVASLLVFLVAVILWTAPAWIGR